MSSPPLSLWPAIGSDYLGRRLTDRPKNSKKAILEAFSEDWKPCTPNSAGDGCVDDQTGKRNFYNKDMQKVIALEGGKGVLDANFASGTFGRDGSGSSGSGSSSSSSSGGGSGSSSTDKSSADTLRLYGTLAFAAIGAATAFAL